MKYRFLKQHLVSFTSLQLLYKYGTLCTYDSDLTKWQCIRPTMQISMVPVLIYMGEIWHIQKRHWILQRWPHRYFKLINQSAMLIVPWNLASNNSFTKSTFLLLQYCSCLFEENYCTKAGINLQISNNQNTSIKVLNWTKQLKKYIKIMPNFKNQFKKKSKTLQLITIIFWKFMAYRYLISCESTI